jgi:multisubunit Na+/H+ antiporter MnhF subunit
MYHASGIDYEVLMTKLISVIHAIHTQMHVIAFEWCSLDFICFIYLLGVHQFSLVVIDVHFRL